jgi:hypothetical protein
MATRPALARPFRYAPADPLGNAQLLHAPKGDKMDDIEYDIFNAARQVETIANSLRGHAETVGARDAVLGGELDQVIERLTGAHDKLGLIATRWHSVER